MIYFDNNSTTLMPPQVVASMAEWCNRGNPSASYASAQSSRKMISKFKDYIAGLCGVKTNCINPKCTDPLCYRLVFTSGASESNCTIVQTVVDSYIASSDRTPHIVASAIEHRSILDLVQVLVDRGTITATLIKPNIRGYILPELVLRAIQPNTCLVTVMQANNETGAINDVHSIGAIAHQHNIPFHTDIVQMFGKDPIQPRVNVDSYSISFHKFGGPPGVGLLAIRHKLVIGYKLQPLIHGAQNDGLRGGTENLPGIGASYTALQLAMTDRLTKNNSISILKSCIVSGIAARIPTRTYSEYVAATSKGIGNGPPLEIVLLSSADINCLSNTILLSIVKRSTPYICNSKVKSELEREGIIVSVGSACNTSSTRASHVLYAMGADELIRKGALRITLGDTNTMNEAVTFVRTFVEIVEKNSRKK
jgi:cysteine desulfurase